MTDRLLIPKFAKSTARKALAKRKPGKASPGIIRGVSQAKHLLTRKFLTRRKALQFHRFYQRRKNCMTRKCEAALNLWGGRKFLKTKVFRFIRRKK